MAAARIVIAAGGTAGHVMPALAVAEELRARGAEVSFAGTPDRAEATLVPAAGFALDHFRVRALPRRPSLGLARAVATDAGSPLACARILRRRRAQVVLGGGGYVSGPMLLAARALRIPGALMESDAHVGLANRLSAPLAQTVFLSYPVADRTSARYRVVGRPVARRFFEVSRNGARASLGLREDAFVFAAFGALAGARRINQAVVDAFGGGSLDGIVLHVSGERDHAEIRDLVTAPIDRYRLEATAERFERVLAAADLCVSRAGGTVFELAAAGLPALLVPFPHATGDHQLLNAQHFARHGAAVIIDDGELDGARLEAEVARLRTQAGRLVSMSAAMHALARPDAAREVAEGVLELVGARP